jgi:hypothetical protein
MVCDNSAKTPIVSEASFNMRSCDSQIIVRSSHACYGFTLNPLFRWIEAQKIFLGVALIVSGLYLGILGKKQFKLSICMIGGIVFTLLSSLFLFTVILSRSSPPSAGWIIMGVCTFLSIFVGLALAYFSKVGAAVAAGWGGVALGLILYNTFVYKIDTNGQVVFWIFIVLMGGIFAGLAFVIFWHVIILATSFAGAYAVIRGISLYAGGFPGELEIVDLIKNNKLESMPGTFYAYMAGFVVLSVLFAYVQFRFFGTHSESDKGGQKKTRHHYHAITGRK